MPVSYQEQGGGCLMARIPDEPADSWPGGRWTRDGRPDAWELKRLWVRPLARGLGLGRVLTRRYLIAPKADRKALYLDTVPAAMAAAHALP